MINYRSADVGQRRVCLELRPEMRADLCSRCKGAIGNTGKKQSSMYRSKSLTLASETTTE